MFSKRAQTAKIALVHPPADSDKATAVGETTANVQKFTVRDGAIPSAEPEPDPRPRMRPLLERVTRDQVVSALLACVSIGALFLFWYLGTKYRIEFYIRFKNVPTPYEVLQQGIQVGLSTKFLVNVVYSLRRIML